MAIKDIKTLAQLTALSYQTAKMVIERMEVPQAEILFAELQEHVDHMYSQTAGYAAPKVRAVVVDEMGQVVPVFKPAPVRPKDFNALMGGIKKLEVLYGYFYDKLNDTTYAEVR